MTDVLRHFSDDLLRGYTVGAASDGAGLAVACHLELCPTCQRSTALHEAALDSLQRSSPTVESPPRAVRDRLIAALSPRAPAPAPRAPRPLPVDLPTLPTALMNKLAALDDVAWRTLLPGMRAIDLDIPSAWRARLVSFRPGIAIPIHDHAGPEHTVVFSGGLIDAGGHLGRGDAATMMPGDTHRQRSAPGESCVALIISEAPARPLTATGKILKWLTRS